MSHYLCSMQKPPPSPETVRLNELLEWYAEAGVDAALHDNPVDRFAEHEAQRRAVVKAKEAVAQRTISPAEPTTQTAAITPRADEKRTVPNSEAVESAMQLASNAQTLDELRDAISGFEGCNLKFSARSIVFCDGNPDARLMVIGEGPGGDEDAQGLPFVGRSGQLLDRMLAAIGLDRTSVYISNIVPWRPPGNRKPTPQETAICLPFIRRHIELARPDVLLLLGNTPAQALLDTSQGITRLRGRWQEAAIGKTMIPAMPSFHPAYLLRQPGQKKFAWRDLLALSQRLNESAGAKTE